MRVIDVLVSTVPGPWNFVGYLSMVDASLVEPSCGSCGAHDVAATLLHELDAEKEILCRPVCSSCLGEYLLEVCASIVPSNLVATARHMEGARAVSGV